MAPTERDIQILSAMQTALSTAIEDNHSKIMSLRTAPSTRNMCQIKRDLMQAQHGALEKAIGLMKDALPGRKHPCEPCNGSGAAQFPDAGNCKTCRGKGQVYAY